MPPRLQKVLDLLDEPMTCKEIASATCLSQSVAHSALINLMERGLVDVVVLAKATRYVRAQPPEITETTVQRAIKSAHPLHNVWRTV